MRRHVVLVATVLCLAVVGPAVAAPGPTDVAAGTTDARELHRLRDRLEAAEGDLAGLDAAVDAATTALDRIDGRLAEAEGELAATRGELASAERAHEQARHQAEVTTRALQQANASLQQARDRAADQEAVLAARVRSMWKYGGSDPRDLLLEGLARSESLHDATMTLQAAQDLVEADRDLTEQVDDAARQEARARTAVAESRLRARRAEAGAAAERQRVARLVAEQAQLVAAVAGEHRARQAVLDALATDREAAARIVEHLDTRVAALSHELARALATATPDASFDGPVPAWASGLPPRGRALAPALVGAAGVAGVDARLFAALVWSESDFHPAALSHAGAQGLAQLMPTTAAGLGVDAHDPVQNLVGGARYLRLQLERFGSADLALAAYNAGPGRVQAAGNRVPDITETQVYVLRVLERYQRLIARS